LYERQSNHQSYDWQSCVDHNEYIIILSLHVVLADLFNRRLSLVNQRNGRGYVRKPIADLIKEFGQLSDCDWRIKKIGEGKRSLR